MSKQRLEDQPRLDLNKHPHLRSDRWPRRDARPTARVVSDTARGDNLETRYLRKLDPVK